MATSIDAFNNVGPKFRFDIPVTGQEGEIISVFLTEELGTNIGLISFIQSVSGPVNVVQNVKAHTRKQYPGDTTTISVPAHQRLRSEGGVLFNNTLPGKSAFLGVVNPGPPRDQKEIQFQFTGSYARLLAAFQGRVDLTLADGEALYLRSPNGVPKALELVPSSFTEE